MDTRRTHGFSHDPVVESATADDPMADAAGAAAPSPAGTPTPHTAVARLALSRHIVPWSAMATHSSRQLYLTLLDMDESVIAPAALARLYRAYAQTRMSEAGILVDLDTVCGHARPLDGLG